MARWGIGVRPVRVYIRKKYHSILFNHFVLVCLLCSSFPLRCGLNVRHQSDLQLMDEDAAVLPTTCLDASSKAPATTLNTDSITSWSTPSLPGHPTVNKACAWWSPCPRMRVPCSFWKESLDTLLWHSPITEQHGAPYHGGEIPSRMTSQVPPHPSFLQVCLISSLHLLYYSLCSPSSNSGAAAVAVAGDHHDVCVMWC